MKIKSITLGGFKGIKNKAVLPLAPITLLFGANSTGKSTILQGLLYLYEVLVNQNLDAETSQLTGNKVYLGGFKNLMHGKHFGGEMTLGMTIDMSEEQSPLLDFLTSHEHENLFENAGVTPDTACDTWGFELSIAWDSHQNRPYISKYECFGNGELFCRFEKREGTPATDLNYFKLLPHWEKPEFFDDFDIVTQMIQSAPIPLNKQLNALPNIYSRLNFSDTVWDWKDMVSNDDTKSVQLFSEAAVSQATLAPLHLIVRHLRKINHLGPLRGIPDSCFKAKKKTSSERWYDGSAAWDHFAFGSENLKERVNKWFGSKTGFNTPYKFTYPKEDSSHQTFDQIYDQRSVYAENLKHERMIHQLPELGVGISQVFPVVVGIFAENEGVLSCEQPELHIHPRWQLVLSDMMLAQLKHENEKMFPYGNP